MKDHTEEYFKDIDNMFKEREEEKERNRMLRERIQGKTNSQQNVRNQQHRTYQEKNNVQKSNTKKEEAQKNYKKSQQNSIGKESITITIKKKEIPKKIIALALATALTITTVLIVKKISDDNYEAEIDKYIIEMIVPDSINKYDILINYQKPIPGKLDSEGKPIYSYDVNKLAKDLLACDATYSELLIYNIFKNMKFYREDNIKNLIREIIYQSQNTKETNLEWYSKFMDVSNFDEYLIKIRCIDETGKPSIEKYEEYCKTLYRHFDDDLKMNYGGIRK